MDLLEFLVVLAAFVAFFSGLGWSYLSKRYDSVLVTKFPSMSPNLSTHQWWQSPVTKIRRWRKASKLGDGELTQVAKKCCFLMYITFASVTCLFLQALICASTGV